MSTQLSLFSQRWRDHRESYRPAGEPINPRLYEVAELAGYREAKAFILAHHYSLSYPSARVRFGLFTRGCLVGVAVFSYRSSSFQADGPLLGNSHLDEAQTGELVKRPNGALPDSSQA